ncbi:helix-turn-helix domain-containing protein [Chryseobacterium oncorhynchi]|uniref:Chromosomal replication initiator DnaA C-terminal domain-containing protein n=1 Tax=Chryseobacterium oncorhynchi TaxID=741074 RepID=A0A316WME6_9FLAO|nr:hypothetical protein C1638_017505 [Chryseobacterium oncorhynchi]
MKSKCRIPRIVVKICNTLDVTTKEVRSQNRRQDYCDARKIISNVLKSEGLTYEHIGRILKRNHSTIVYNLKEYDFMINSNRNFQYKVSVIKQVLKNEKAAYT